MKKIFFITLLALTACAHNSSAPPVSHGGICVIQPDSQKCHDGTIGTGNQ